MKRTAITSPGMEGHWFDSDKAEHFDEETWHDGHNHVSKATGSPHRHERLFFTKSGKWVKNEWSAYQGERESYEVISENEAVVWFLRQEMNLPVHLEGKDKEFEI